MKILVVDDEHLARERLIDLISELSITTSIIEAEHGLVALDKVDQDSPDIILLDIRMPLMDGLEVAQHLTHLDTPPAIIFTTAYQDHALEAFDMHAIDYLLKPIRKERLQHALEKAQILGQSKLNKIREINKSAGTRSHLSANVHGNIKLVPVKKIYYLKAEQKYVIAAWSGGELLLDESLKSLESEFTELFVRIHRNALVALQFIDALEKDNQRNVCIHLHGVTQPLQVSRRHVSNVRQAIKKLAQ
jgi:two-component system response regulator AlgR